MKRLGLFGDWLPGSDPIIVGGCSNFLSPFATEILLYISRYWWEMKDNDNDVLFTISDLHILHKNGLNLVLKFSIGGNGKTGIEICVSIP